MQHILLSCIQKDGTDVNVTPIVYMKIMHLNAFLILQRVAESQTTLTEEEEAAEDVGGSQQEDRAHLVTQVKVKQPPSHLSS